VINREINEGQFKAVVVVACMGIVQAENERGRARWWW